MIKNKRQMFIIIGVFTLVLMLGTVTYAFFNYTRTGSSNTISVGRISFVTRQTSTINLTNAFPIDRSDIDTDTDNVDEVVIEIEGDTDYVGGIEYLVSSVDSEIYSSTGQTIPIGLDITVEDLGTSNDNYFTARENTNESIYKKLIGDTLVGDQMLLVGYIVPNTTSGTAEGIDGSITIKAFFDKDVIAITDTYDGSESDLNGTTENWVANRTILTTTEWNALQTNGVSFKIKVEANEGIWVNGSLEEIIKINNIGIDIENGVDFSKTSDQDNTSGVYTRAGTQNDAYPIMYYRGAVENNNVLFNNKCWKAVRTTDTGGVKLIYSGEAGAVYDEIPLTESQYTIPSGATNNFTFNSNDNSWEITITDNAAKEISFTVPAGDGYILVQTGTSGPSTGGMYYYYMNGTSVNSFGNGGGALMNDIYSFGTLTASDVIKWRYTGSSSIASPITFKLQMLYPGDLIVENGCNNIGKSTIISVDVNGSPQNAFTFNNNFYSPANVGYMYGDEYTYSSANWTSGARFGSSFTWDGSSYTLIDDETTTPNATHHYSCNVATSNGTCAQLRYVYYVSGSTKYYITLTGGDGVEEALVKMQTNTNDSNAKDKIDTWYASNMNTVTNKLEDTIWCNDRSFGDGNNNGWIANGGSLSTYLYYGARERSNGAQNTSTVKNQPSLACANKNDAFTWKNSVGNRALDYPVGMLTEDEMVLAGELLNVTNGNSYLNSGSCYWGLSPQHFSSDTAIMTYFYHYVGYESVIMPHCGLRPSISIKPGLPVVKGTGTATDPYVIE